MMPCCLVWGKLVYSSSFYLPSLLSSLNLPSTASAQGQGTISIDPIGMILQDKKALEVLG